VKRKAISDAVSETLRIEFIANPMQRRFIESRAQADLFSSRKGEGKSAGLCWAAFFYTQHNPGAHGLCIRDTYANLQRTTMQEFFHWFPDGVFGNFNATEKCWTWDHARTGLKGKIFFMGADDEKAASKIASMPLAFALVDEPSPAAGESEGIPEMIFDTIIGQLRQPGMKWYAVKLAQNNPDESHWTYRRFVDPGNPPELVNAMLAASGERLLPMQQPGFMAYQTKEPENKDHLPPGYYTNLRALWSHRPDLLKRFVEGQYGFQQVGRKVTPEWSDAIHLATGLMPVKGQPLWLLYDGGLNPTCIITQLTPLGYWLILQAHVGDGIGMYQLIRDVIKPIIQDEYEGFELKHTGDPNLKMREQSNSLQSAAKVIVRELGGRYIPGPTTFNEVVDPLKSVLTKTINGTGLVQVDRHRAKAVWHALRGGWHFKTPRGGAEGSVKKNKHSHPGDAMGHGAARLFPLGKPKVQGKGASQGRRAGSYYARSPVHRSNSPSTMKTAKGVRVPKNMRTIGGL
jgi:hypothetical protein